jgi:predicted phosphodiesterase
MKLGLISDVHLEFYRFDPRVDMPGCSRKPIEGYTYFHFGFALPTETDADVLVVAGDIHPDEKVRTAFKNKLEDHYKKPVLFSLGNHDSYYGFWPHMSEPIFEEIDGVTFGIASLWTDFPDLEKAHHYRKELNDFRLIDGITVEKWLKTHRYHREALYKAAPDVVITHHAPSYRSVKSSFVGDVLNMYYVSDMDEEVEDMGKRGTKVWFHGHTHHTCDYQIEDVRVVCNAFGYPGEKGRGAMPEWKVVEIASKANLVEASV